MSPIITGPDVPQLGVPEGVKQTGQRIDFKPTQFDLAIETKGYLLLWERAGLCPCNPVTTQTEQPDPNCSLCKGQGWLYFGTTDAQILTEYELTELQQKMLDDTGGMVIRGIMHSFTTKRDHLDVASNWVEGTANLTVRHGNRLGYYDRLTTLDAEIVYSEIVMTDGTTILSTRYPAVGVNQIRSVDKIYKIGVDFHIDKGVVTWLRGYVPETDVRLAAHYLCHPVWLVIEHPHAARLTLKKFKTPAPKTPTGDAEKLPVQALVRYDFLPGPKE